MAEPLPLVIGPEDAAVRIAAGGVRVVDLRKPESFQGPRVPGAVHAEYASLVREEKPVGGLLPDSGVLSAALSSLGIERGQQVIAYDDEGNGRAGRLVWTLAALGHDAASILDGGIAAWIDAGLAPQGGAPGAVAPSRFVAGSNHAVVAERDWLLAHLGDPGVAIVDTRSPKEYRGEDVRSARGGHVPGAVNFDWVRAMDPARHRRIRPRDELLAELAALGITPDREVVTYCQTHHRSSHTWVVLRWLGFERVRGYPGAWSDWGNAADTPVTVGDRP